METRVFEKKDFVEVDGVLTFNDEVNEQGNIEIAGGLGRIKFSKSVVAKGFIFVKAGSDIEAGSGIKAGSDIITLRESVLAKFVICRRITVGFAVNQEKIIDAEIRKGKVILGKVIEKKVK